MLEEKEIKKIVELKEKGLTIKEIAKAVGRSESSVKKYTSDNYERDNEIDEKTGKILTEQMLEEGYDFEDDIKPLVYKLKLQANEIDITLFDYLKDISNTMNKFLRITDTPQWFYYVFCELANSLSVITDHIEAEILMNTIDNFYNREISMEESENFLAENEEKAERLLENTKEELNDLNKQIKIYQENLTSLKSINTQITMKLLEAPNREKLKLSEENLINMENQMKKLQIANTILIEKCKSLDQTDKENIKLKQELSAFNMVFNKIHTLFPQQIDDIVQEIENEIQ